MILEFKNIDNITICNIHINDKESNQINSNNNNKDNDNNSNSSYRHKSN